jgi:Undecaprenyl pyrophosphate synthase
MLAGSGPQVSNPPRPSVVPRHVAIIMDGNGRWARERGLPRLAGHRAGTENTRRIIESCVELDIPVLTLYAFSTENWGRPREEVDGLFAILADVIERETEALHERGGPATPPRQAGGTAADPPRACELRSRADQGQLSPRAQRGL